MSLIVTNDIEPNQLNQILDLIKNCDDFIINSESLKHSLEDNDLFIVFYNDNLIGLVTTLIYPKYASIQEFLIIKPYRHKGIGRKVLRILENQLLHMNVVALRLHSINSSKLFWKKVGFKEDPSSRNGLKMYYKVLIAANVKAEGDEIKINVWNSFSPKGEPIYKNLRINQLAVPCFMDWYIEINENDHLHYQGKAKYCKHIKYFHDFIFSI